MDSAYGAETAAAQLTPSRRGRGTERERQRARARFARVVWVGSCTACGAWEGNFLFFFHFLFFLTPSPPLVAVQLPHRAQRLQALVIRYYSTSSREQPAIWQRVCRPLRHPWPSLPSLPSLPHPPRA